MPLKRTDGILRRCDQRLRFPAEVAIGSAMEAVEAVEGLGADPRLTDATLLLSAAGELVADYLDEQIEGVTNEGA